MPLRPQDRRAKQTQRSGQKATNALRAQASAIVGVDAYEPLCTPTDAQLVVAVQNVADATRQVTVSVRHDGRSLATTSHRVDDGSRLPFSFPVPHDATGLFEVRLSAEQDALAVDNRAFVHLRGTETIPVVVASDNPDFVRTIGGWLDACPRITWTSTDPGTLDRAAHLLITDRAELAAQWSSSTIYFAQMAGERRIISTHWLADSGHPISEYLEPLGLVPAVLPAVQANIQWGDPIIWGVVDGHKIPLVQAALAQGRRLVTLLVDPTASSSSVPVILVFLNSLRWAMDSGGLFTTGQPLMAGPFKQGMVRVKRPDGVVEWLAHAGGMVRYDSTDQAGRYQFTQGEVAMEHVANFLDPIESNTMQHVSTWGTDQTTASWSRGSVSSHHPLTNLLLSLLVVILLAEWIRYCWKGRPERALRLRSGRVEGRHISIHR